MTYISLVLVIFSVRKKKREKEKNQEEMKKVKGILKILDYDEIKEKAKFILDIYLFIIISIQLTPKF